MLARLASPWSTSAHMQNTTAMHQLKLQLLQELLRGMQGWEVPGERQSGNSWDEHSLA